MNRREARLKAVQTLYQIDLTECETEEAIASVIDEEDEKPSLFMEQLIYGTLEHLEQIDPIITESLEGWSLDRMGYVDRAIVRMTLFEMEYIEDIPTNVSYNEGIELAKAFGGEQSSRFVNGVLSRAHELFQEKNK